MPPEPINPRSARTARRRKVEDHEREFPAPRAPRVALWRRRELLALWRRAHIRDVESNTY